ncbi:hypothetical protein INT45_010288 [Circinella minor]|uniref:Helitron helicase-like domain-containing protein n=1 Tax=Circinella minor TaxID=1195481 RepID=A0A8H7VBR5_9FUNG|nr:hypothetical protein INT45_010288 [Circinella minor]
MRSGGVSTFCTNGTMYHDIGSLRLEQQAFVRQAAGELPAEQEHIPQQQQERPKFAQVYFAGKEEQLATQETLFSGLRNETISTLQTVMQESNSYAQGLLNAHKTSGDRPFGTLRVVIRSAANLGRRYDQQSYPEVAAMIVKNTVDGKSLPHEINDLRADLYNVIGYNVDLRQIGHSIILPSSFTRGPQYIKQMLHDRLVIIRQRGNPTLFITFMCNLQWPEIQSELLLPGQQAFNRPDLCSQVFHMKITDMLAHIKESNCFDRVVGYVATVEFQKHGLPHIHILLILHHEDRPHNPANYD